MLNFIEFVRQGIDLNEQYDRINDSVNYRLHRRRLVRIYNSLIKNGKTSKATYHQLIKEANVLLKIIDYCKDKSAAKQARLIIEPYARNFSSNDFHSGKYPDPNKLREIE